MTILVIDEPNEDTKSESKSSLKFFDKFDFIVTSWVICWRMGESAYTNMTGSGTARR